MPQEYCKNTGRTKKNSQYSRKNLWIIKLCEKDEGCVIREPNDEYIVEIGRF